MKTKIAGKLAVTFAIALTAAFAGWSPSSANAQAMKGAEHLLHLNGINTKAEAEALQPGDSMAMVCAKCKSVSVIRVEKETKGHFTRMIPGEKHLCPGCKSTITVVGVGKGPNGVHNEVKHVCEKCGEDSAFCCATKPGSGATKGMEKK